MEHHKPHNREGCIRSEMVEATLDFPWSLFREIEAGKTTDSEPSNREATQEIKNNCHDRLHGPQERKPGAQGLNYP